MMPLRPVAVAGSDGGDPWAWNWVASNPTPQSGKSAFQSAIGTGEHQYLFLNATATMNVTTGATLYAWAYIDPANPPSELMLQWNDTSSWDHRAYWGANNLTYGSNGTVSRQYMGALSGRGPMGEVDGARQRGRPRRQDLQRHGVHALRWTSHLGRRRQKQSITN